MNKENDSDELKAEFDRYLAEHEANPQSIVKGKNRKDKYWRGLESELVRIVKPWLKAGFLHHLI